MRRRWSTRTWLLIFLLLIPAAYFGGRGVISQAYPLRYREILFQRAAEFDIDPYLVAAVIRSESNFRANVTSSQGARGLMQIMPETGRWAAERLQLPYDPEMLYDPEYNIRIGCWYLRSLKAEFGDDNVVVIAAYNGGRSNVKKWLDDRRWTGDYQSLAQIPFPETRHYVENVLRDYARYRRIYAGL